MRRRLVVAITAVAAGAIVLFAVPLAIALRQVYRDEDMLRLERDTVAATRRIDISAHRGDPIELPGGSDRRAVYDRAGHLLAGQPGTHDRQLARTAIATGRPAVKTFDDRIVAAVPLLSGEQESGVLVTGRSGVGAITDTRRAWLLLAALGVTVIIAALTAAVLLGRGLSRPLERLALAARRLGAGDFSARAPRSSVPEVDAVALALDTTAARLGDLVDRERAFSADASHQLRTPLAALRIELEAAELGGSAVDPASALRQVERLEQTIATLLAVARDLPRSEGRTDVLALADRAEAVWRPRLAEEGRRLRLAVEGAPLSAAAHEAVVQEIVDVLLDNALHHGAGATDLSVRRRGDWVSIEVRDEGEGFGGDPEAAFERGRSRDGHGIGLALARSLALAEGGRLMAPDSGPAPAVRLLLPVAAAVAGSTDPAH